MQARRPLRHGLALATFFASGCIAEQEHQPRSFEIQGATAPASCAKNEDVDDRCTMCQKAHCCTEIAACDEGCRTGYQRYEACLYTDGIWSGSSVAQCMKESGMVTFPPVANLVQCFQSSCASDKYCGAEPHAVFAPAADADPIVQHYKPQSPATNFSAAQFLERYCNGCHQPQSLSMAADSTPLTNFTTNFEWFGATWFQSMDYNAVVGKLDIIACGVRADFLPPECTTLKSVHEGFFTTAAKFPPAHPPSQYGGCWWAAGRCLLPTSYERVRLLSWIDDGAPP